MPCLRGRAGSNWDRLGAVSSSYYRPCSPFPRTLGVLLGSTQGRCVCCLPGSRPVTCSETLDSTTFLQGGSTPSVVGFLPGDGAWKNAAVGRWGWRTQLVLREQQVHKCDSQLTTPVWVCGEVAKDRVSQPGLCLACVSASVCEICLCTPLSTVCSFGLPPLHPELSSSDIARGV